MNRTHGGYREGAGRPAIGKRKVVSISLPDQDWEKIDQKIESGEVSSYSEYFRTLHAERSDRDE